MSDIKTLHKSGSVKSALDQEELREALAKHYMERNDHDQTLIDQAAMRVPRLKAAVDGMAEVLEFYTGKDDGGTLAKCCLTQHAGVIGGKMDNWRYNSEPFWTICMACGIQFHGHHECQAGSAPSQQEKK